MNSVLMNAWSTTRRHEPYPVWLCAGLTLKPCIPCALLQGCYILIYTVDDLETVPCAVLQGYKAYIMYGVRSS